MSYSAYRLANALLKQEKLALYSDKNLDGKVTLAEVDAELRRRGLRAYCVDYNDPNGSPLQEIFQIAQRKTGKPTISRDDFEKMLLNVKEDWTKREEYKKQQAAYKAREKERQRKAEEEKKRQQKQGTYELGKKEAKEKLHAFKKLPFEDQMRYGQNLLVGLISEAWEDLDKAFSALDRNNDKQITYDEFMIVLRKIIPKKSEPFITGMSIKELWLRIDTDDSSSLDINEFRGGMRKFFVQVLDNGECSDACWLVSLVAAELVIALEEEKKSFKDFLASLDSNGDGKVTFVELSKGIKKLKSFDAENTRRLFQFHRSHSSNTDGTVSLNILKMLLYCVTPALPDGWREAVDPNTGNVYYYNEATQKTQWEVPKE
mmetsp:Transcript_35220/g.49293  ORF Transcript_35220/g.49293 Transcript_35220/m.49293 type:complete len:374 (+) Transcript_35220:22-1143(+)